MADMFDRLAAGPGAVQQDDYDNWNEMVGAAPRDRVRRVTRDAIRGVPPDEYYDHVYPGRNGTDPLGALEPRQRTSIAEALLSALRRGGVTGDQLRRETNLRDYDPERMSSQDLAELLAWTRRNHPDTLGDVADNYQNRPDILSSILSNKALIALALGLGAKFLSDRARGQQGPTIPGQNPRNFI